MELFKMGWKTKCDGLARISGASWILILKTKSVSFKFKTEVDSLIADETEAVSNSMNPQITSSTSQRPIHGNAIKNLFKTK